jgi:hypothetical protein
VPEGETMEANIRCWFQFLYLQIIERTSLIITNAVITTGVVDRLSMDKSAAVREILFSDDSRDNEFRF